MMRRKFFTQRIALWCGVVVCGLLALWYGAQTRAQQQDNRQVGLQNKGNAGQTPRKIALVIGNGAYQNVRKLKNPSNDANDLAATLKNDLGFELIGGGGLVNLTRDEMRNWVREFGTALAQGPSVGVFYYAGHGVQLNGKNYLIPVEISVRSEADIEDAAVEMQFVLNKMRDARNGLNIVILDACRNNPFEGVTRDGKDGLAEVRAAAGTVVAYATAPGSVAADGERRNGAYTEVLLEQIKTPDVSVTELLQNVSSAVYEKTKRRQEPWQSSSPLTGRFCFAGCEVAAKPTPIPVTPANAGPEPVIMRRNPKDIELEAWQDVRNSADAQDFRDFLEAYPNGANAGNAKIRLEQIVWAATRANGGRAALEAYLKEFPQGDNAGTARLMLNRLVRASQPAPVPVAPVTNPSTPMRQPAQQSNQYGIEFVALGRGTFQMGSPASEEGRYDDEGPQHSVTISKPFAIGKYEVTQEQWQAVMGSNPSKFQNCPKCPVESVSWEDVQQFIATLNGLRNGYTYRLPTEAEWEYAARAGSDKPYYGELDKIAWYDGNSGGKTHDVGTKAANAWGLHDMQGNVWEWVQDWSGAYSSQAVSDPRGPSSGSNRVLRGGSWNGAVRRVRVANRSYSPDGRGTGIGFRVVREQ